MSRASGRTVSETAFETAIDWLVLLRSGEATREELSRLRDWQSANPQHAAAWDQVNGALDRSTNPIRAAEQRSPGQALAAERVILRPISASRRKILRGALALAAVGAGTGLLVDRGGLFPAFTADLRTGTGERRTFTLPDGSSVVLNARSAVDVDFTDARRVVRLRAGELITTVAPDTARPFTVYTVHGAARALGTRFLVRREQERSLALVLEHSVTVTTAGGSETTLREGEGLWFSRDRSGRVRTDLAGKAAWVNGMLSVRDEPLGEVIAAVRPYRAGFIRVAPAAARLRVLGAFPLDDPDRLLESLAQTLPVRINTYGRWLVVIDGV